MDSGKLRRVPNQPRTPVRSVRIPDDLWEAATNLAAERGRTVSEMIRECLENLVAEAKIRKE
jgi:predicted DNA-binding protein